MQIFEHNQFNQYLGATWQPTIVPRGTQSLTNKTATCRHLIRPCQPTRICRVSIADSPTSLATCQPLYDPINFPCQLMTSPVPRHHTITTSDADVIRATCHPSSGDTCHLRIGPSVRRNVQNCLPRVTTRGCHMSPVQTCHVSSVQTCHVSVRTDYTDCTVNNFFPV
jgi:hypothetical protein